MNIYSIYLAGGMQNLSIEEQTAWRDDVKQSLEKYECDYKIKCIDPTNYYTYDEENTYDSDLEVMQFDLHKLKKSNLVILNFNDPGSLGSMAELAIAYENGIPVIGLNEDEKNLHTWQYFMCSKIFTDREDMLYYIENYYLE